MKMQRAEKGFTLIELMIAILLGMLVLAGALTIFQGSNRATTMQNLDNRMQDNARMAMDVVARNMRRAGFLVNFSAYTMGKSINGLTTKVTTSNYSNAPDIVRLVGGSLTPLGELQFNAQQGANTIVLEPGSDLSKLSAGDVIGVGLTYTGIVTNVNAGTKTVTIGNGDATAQGGVLNMFFPGTYSAGATPSGMDAVPVRLLSMTRYEIDGSDPAHPVLMQVTGSGGNREPLVEDIEDLQLAYGVDTNNDRMISAGEWTSTPVDIDKIRLVRITIVARTAQPDPNLVGVAQQVPAIEDRNAWEPTDGYRRYILTRIVKCRSIEALTML